MYIFVPLKLPYLMVSQLEEEGINLIPAMISQCSFTNAKSSIMKLSISIWNSSWKIIKSKKLLKCYEICHKKMRLYLVLFPYFNQSEWGLAKSSFWLVKKKNTKQDNWEDMRKIHMTLQFFRLVALTVIFLKKKNPFLDKVNGSMCAKFQVCIVFHLARRSDTNKNTNNTRIYEWI